jgi:RES domain-containing protein
MQNPRRDSKLIDALDDLSPTPLKGTLWRVVREGRDPCSCSASGGRWDDATFNVLYTAEHRDGALAEMYFHLLRGQPVFPSRVAYRLHELAVDLPGVLDLTDLVRLAALGVDVARFGQLSYQERQSEYPRTQEVAEVAYFLDHAGIVVPSARWNCRNVIIFCDRTAPAAFEAVKDHGLIDWRQWAKANANSLKF